MMGENIGDVLVCVSELFGYDIGKEYSVNGFGSKFDPDSNKRIDYIWVESHIDSIGIKSFSRISYKSHMICWTEYFITKEQYIRNKKLEELVSNID